MFYNTQNTLFCVWFCEVLKGKHDRMVEAHVTGYW